MYIFHPEDNDHEASVYTKTDTGNGYASDFIANVSAITDAYFSGLSPRPLPPSLRRDLSELN
jgi:hypothetical protein